MASAAATNPLPASPTRRPSDLSIQPALAATEGQSFSGRVANFVNPNAAHTTPADFTATIDWGGSTTTGGLVSNPGAFPCATNIYAVDGAHTSADEGSFTF